MYVEQLLAILVEGLHGKMPKEPVSTILGTEEQGYYWYVARNGIVNSYTIY